MSKLQQIEYEIQSHTQRVNHCAACLRSITDTTTPACDVLVELNRQAREINERRQRYAGYKRTIRKVGRPVFGADSVDDIDHTMKQPLEAKW